QIERAAVLADDAFKEQLSFAPHRATKTFIEIRKQGDIGRDRRQVAEVQPLCGEVVDEGLRPRILQEPPHLALEHLGSSQFPAAGEIQELIVRNAAPQKEREPRCQLQVTDTIDTLLRRGLPGIALEAEQEFRMHEQPAEGHFNAKLESVGTPFVIERQQDSQVALRYRAPIGALRQGRENRRGAAAFTGGACWITSENPPLARGLCS